MELVSLHLVVYIVRYRQKTEAMLSCFQNHMGQLSKAISPWSELRFEWVKLWLNAF